MAKTIEPNSLEAPSPRQLGRHLRAVRRAKRLSRAEVARSAGLTKRELSALERGRAEISDNDLWCLAGSCGVDVSDLLPRRDELDIGSQLSSLTIGDAMSRLREPAGEDAFLNEYLAMIYELRNLAPGSRIPLREPDLVALADALGGTPEAIEARLHELIGASREEAARLRAMILPPLALPSPLDSVAAAHALSDSADTNAEDFWTRRHDPLDPASDPLLGGGGLAPPPFPNDAYAPNADPYASNGHPFDAEPDPFAGVEPPPPPFGTPAGPAATMPPPWESADVAPPWEPADVAPPWEPADAAPPWEPAEAADVAPPWVSAPDDLPPPPGAPGTMPAADLPPPPPPFAVPAFVGGAGIGRDDDPMSPVLGGFGGPESGAEDPFAISEITNSTEWHEAVSMRDERWPSVDLVSAPPHPDVTTLDDLLRAPLRDRATFDDSAPVAHTDDAAVPGVAAITDWPSATTTDDFTTAELDGESPTASFNLLAAAVAAAEAEGALEDVDQAAEDDPVPASEPDDDFPPTSLVTNVDDVDDEDGSESVDGLADQPRLDFEAAPSPAPPTLVELDDVAPIAWSAVVTEPVTTPLSETVPLIAAERSAPSRYEQAGPDWEIGGTFPATAIGDDGALSLRRAEFRWALADLRATRDIAVEASLDFGAGAGFGVVFLASVDATGRLSGYSFDVDPVYAGGSFLVRQWEEDRQHWKPIAQVAVDDPTRLYGPHVLLVVLRDDQLEAFVDGEIVLTVGALSRESLNVGRSPCSGDRVGVQAWSTTDVTVSKLRVGYYD